MRIIPTTLALHHRMLRLHSRTTQCALHFTISPVIARRTYVYVRTKMCTYTRDGFMQPKTRYTRCMRRVYEVNISYAAVRPHTISDHCLWPDTILRRTPYIFLPVTFILGIYCNKSRFGSSMRVDVRFPDISIRYCITSATYDRVSLNSTMKLMLFN